MPTLDILRGFALLGILAVNIEDFAGPEALHDIPVGLARAALVGWHAHLDLLILTIKWLFVEGKMRAMFAMLFGAGAVLLTERLEARGGSGCSADIFLRRNLWLALFGLLHGTLIWGGDILLDYSLCALSLIYPLRRVAPARLISVGLVLALLGGTLGISNFMGARAVLREDALRSQAVAALHSGHAPTVAQQAALKSAEDGRKALATNATAGVEAGRQSYLQSLPRKSAEFIDFVFGLIRSGWMAEILGSIILGMGLYKSGFLTGRFSTRSYLLTAALGYGVSAPIVIIGIWLAGRDHFSTAAAIEWMYLPYGLEQIPAVLANASVLLLLSKTGQLTPLLKPLGAVGKMALTNYIFTSLACQFIFAWGPWKLYGALDYYQYLYVAAGIWALNLLLSQLWLRVFAFGPLEWVWRSLTYWKLQPLLLGSNG